MATLEEVMALARELNVSNAELLTDARRFKLNVESLEQLDDFLCRCLVNSLKYFAYLKAEDPDAVFGDIYEKDEEDDDEFDLEKQMDKWEVQYLEECRRDAEARAERYRDYCERKYGWDCS